MEIAAASAPNQVLSSSVSVSDELPRARDVEHQHTVGSLMWTSFAPAGDLQCESAWRPADGFESWDGSVAWAMEQLLEQIEAQLDLVGVVVDDDGVSNNSAGFESLESVLLAARDLLEQGLRPRLFPVLDSTAIAARHEAATGEPLDLSTAEGLEAFYAPVRTFYETARSALSDRYLAVGTARFDGGPALAAMHASELLGADEAALIELNARFASDFGSECYFIADEGNPALCRTARYRPRNPRHENPGVGRLRAVEPTPPNLTPLSSKDFEPNFLTLTAAVRGGDHSLVTASSRALGGDRPGGFSKFAGD